MARMQDGLEVVTRLLRSDEPVTYEGRFYHLRGATLLARPQRPGGPQILIGGNGPKRTLRLAARYADVWNGVFLSPEEFRARSAVLDDLLAQADRQPHDVRRTLMTAIFFGRDLPALDRQLESERTFRPELASTPRDELIAIMRQRNVIVGTPEMAAEQIAAYARAGVAELMLQWLDQEDIEGLHGLAEVVRSL